MLNGLEKTPERKVQEKDRRWQTTEETAMFKSNDEPFRRGWHNIADQALPEDHVAGGTSF